MSSFPAHQPPLPIHFVLAPAPAILVGAIVMRGHGIAPNVWGVNVVVWLVMAFACVIWARCFRGTRSAPGIPAWGATALLAATFFFRGTAGVHRWLFLGPIQVHVADVVIPLILISDVTRDLSSVSTVLVSTLILALQPDAAQATALSVAAGGAILLKGDRIQAYQRSALGMLAGLCALSWLKPDALVPVAHVEGIVAMAIKSQQGLGPAAIVAIALLPFPFILQARRNRDSRYGLIAFSLSLYFATAIAVSIPGRFPVIIMGYGASAVIGYVIALGWLMYAQNGRLGHSSHGSV